MRLRELLKSKLIIKSIYWNSLDALVYPLLLLLATPVFVNKLGVELYGIWMFVNTIMASIGVFNAGLGDATIKFVSKYITKQKSDEVNKIIGATYSIYVALGFIVIAVSFVIAYLIKNFDLFDITKNYKTVSFYAILITGITLTLKFIEQIFLSVFRGFDRYDVASKISILGKLLVVLINMALAYWDFSLIHILISTCLITFLFLIVEGILVYRFSGFTAFFPAYEKKYINEVFSFGIWSWLQSIIGIIAGQIDKFVVISLSDIKTFAYYSIALTVFGQIHACFAASVSWLFALVSKKIYNNEKIQPLYNQIQFYFLIVVTISLVSFFLIKDPLILWWLGNETYDGSIGFINLFIAYNLIMAVSIIPTYFLNASGQIQLTTLFSLSTLISRIIFIPVFYYFLGSGGIVLGLLISGILITPWQISTFNKRVFENNDSVSGLKLLIPIALFFLIYTQDNILIVLLVLVAVLISYGIIFQFSFRKYLDRLRIFKRE